jgi:metallo-beta-lactamase class B
VKRLAVIAFALLAASPGARAQTIQEFLKASIAHWNTPTEPFRIIGNIDYVGTNGLAVYLITSPQGHILIDTGLPEATPQIRSSIAKLGFKVADIKYLLNTHAHLDHTGGFAELKKETGAQLIAGAADRPLLEGGYYPGQERTLELRFPPVKVDRTVGDGDTSATLRLPLTQRQVTHPAARPGP